MRYLLPWFRLSDAPAGIVTEPQEIAIFISHLSLDADLVAIEVVGLLPVYFFHSKEIFNIFDNRFI